MTQLSLAVPGTPGKPPRHRAGEAQSLSWAPPPLSCALLQLPQDLSYVPPIRVAHGGSGAAAPAWAQPLGLGAGVGSAFSWAPAPRAGATSLEPYFVSASSSRQHPAKTSTGIVNADAVEEGLTHLGGRRDLRAHLRCRGVCDGVSGVQHLGIPPDELPKELLRSCRARLQLWSRRESELDDGPWLTSLIEEAYAHTRLYGATTLLLAVLRGSSLVTANLGDCALLVLRPCGFHPLRLRPVFKTEPGRYDARRPVQVQRLHGFSDSNAHVVIQGAMVSTTPVQHGDLLVLGSDGLFDNLRDEDIQRTVERCCSPPSPADAGWRVPSPVQLKQTATALVDFAIASVKLERPEAEKAGPWIARGGDVPANNADDTTALVAVVVAPADAAASAGTGCEELEPLESCAGVINF